MLDYSFAFLFEQKIRKVKIKNCEMAKRCSRRSHFLSGSLISKLLGYGDRLRVPVTFGKECGLVVKPRTGNSDFGIRLPGARGVTQ